MQITQMHFFSQFFNPYSGSRKEDFYGTSPRTYPWGIVLKLTNYTQQKVQRTFTVRKTYVKRTFEHVR